MGEALHAALHSRLMRCRHGCGDRLGLAAHTLALASNKRRVVIGEQRRTARAEINRNATSAPGMMSRAGTTDTAAGMIKAVALRQALGQGVTRAGMITMTARQPRIHVMRGAPALADLILMMAVGRVKMTAGEEAMRSQRDTARA